MTMGTQESAGNPDARLKKSPVWSHVLSTCTLSVTGFKTMLVTGAPFSWTSRTAWVLESGFNSYGICIVSVVAGEQAPDAGQGLCWTSQICTCTVTGP